MEMNLKKLFEMQKVLDARIEKEHPRVDGEDRLAKKILSLQVELGELANEWRGFKFWSTNQNPSKNIHTTVGATEENAVKFVCADEDECGETFDKSDARLLDIFGEIHEDCPICKNGFLYAMRLKSPLLEEYVDCLHFILSIGLEIDFNIVEEMPFIENDIGTRKYNNLTTQFIWLCNTTAEIYNHGKRYYDLLLTEFLALGEMLGFTWEQIEQAYIKKNEVNHERQATGY